jgi:hypothetical protein
MINFTCLFTAPPTRWLNGIQLRLEKIPGNEDNHLLDNIPQYGNRSDKSAISAVELLKCLILRQLRKNTAALNNDAAGAFDGMIPSFGMLCICRLGVPLKIIDLKLQVLRQTRLYP